MINLTDGKPSTLPGRTVKPNKRQEGTMGTHTDKTVIVLMGWSGAGKDELCKTLQQQKLGWGFGFKFKFSRKMKTFVEQNYRLPYGALDDPYIRLQPVPTKVGHETGKTYLDVMVELYHLWKKVDDEMTAYGSMFELLDMMKDKDVAIITDVRKKCEVDYLVEYKKKTGYKLYTIRIHSSRAKVLTTDALCDQLTETLKVHSDEQFTVFNHGSLEEYQAKGKELASILGHLIKG